METDMGWYHRLRTEQIHIPETARCSTRSPVMEATDGRGRGWVWWLHQAMENKDDKNQLEENLWQWFIMVHQLFEMGFAQISSCWMRSPCSVVLFLSLAKYWRWVAPEILFFLVWDPAIAWHPRRLEGFFGQKMFNPLISSHLCFFFWCQTSRSFEGESTKCMGEHTQCMYRSWLGLSKYTCWGGHLHFSPFWRLVWERPGTSLHLQK